MLPAGNVAPNLSNEKKDSMAQRQRLGFQIQGRGIELPLCHFLEYPKIMRDTWGSNARGLTPIGT